MKQVITFLSVVVAALIMVVIGLSVTIARNGDSGDGRDVVAEARHHEEKPKLTELESEPTKPLTEEWELRYRIPETTMPLHYEIYLHPDLELGVFHGRTDIVIKALEAKKHLVAHVENLELETVELFENGEGEGEEVGEEIELEKWFEYKPNQYLVVIPRRTLGPGTYRLRVKYGGSLTNGITGFYKSVYTTSAGEKRSIATSKFQPTHARRAFPCFDEPNFKSTFTVRLVRPSEDYVALSNMPVASEKGDSPSAGLTTVEFEKSVPMVTYLACFIVCDFDYVEKFTERHGTKFRVYSTPDQIDRTAYALEIGANITDYFTDYFDIRYPLPKQDMIAIPDFVSGAMEHWGLITYREANVLYSDRESSSGNKQRVAAVISHELAHMWFGNLVTLKWWDDLWLNEGFASYMEYKGINNFHPDWDVDSLFLTSDLHRVMSLDSTTTSHPIVQTVDTPDQITELFDTISYSKGASVLRMCENFMGADNFRDGIRNFLKKYEYGNAVTQDLWDELQKVSDQRGQDLDMTKIMDTWTRQMGYPVLQLEKGKSSYAITQERYLSNPKAKGSDSSSPFDYKWDVPVTWITSKDSDRKQVFFHTDEERIEVKIPPGVKWMKFNVGQYGFYRVNYPSEDWNALASILTDDHESLSPSDRASLVNDAASLAASGHIPYSVFLNMVKFLRKERHLIPWQTAYSQLVDILILLETKPAYSDFRDFVIFLVEEAYDELGWKDEGTHLERLLRVKILSLACRCGYAPCLKEAAERFRDWVSDDDEYLPSNLRSLTYKYGIRALPDSDAWHEMFERYRREINAQEKGKLLYGLASTSQPWLIHKLLREAEDPDVIRNQDYFHLMAYVSYNPVGAPIAWDYVRSNWEKLVERFEISNRYLGRLPKTLSSHFATDFQLEQMKSFFMKYPEAGAGKRARKQALENVVDNIEWLEKHEEPVSAWLKEQSF